MKTFKRIILSVLLLIVVGFLFRGWFYYHFVSYRSIGERNQYSILNKDLTGYIESGIDRYTKPDIHQIVKLSLVLTSSHLNFTASKHHIDPNNLMKSGTAHCVGYANFFTTTCNYLILKNNLAHKWKATSHKGQLYLFDINLHNFLESPFLKDHDFVTIENKISGEVIAVDPSLNDYFHIDYINFKK
jgi:hypothetical protein